MLIFFFFSCSTKSPTIGIGVFNFEPEDDRSLLVFDSPRAMNRLFELNAEFSTSKARLHVKSFPGTPNRFEPLKYGGLQGFASLRVIEYQEGWLKVITNESQGYFGWLKGSFKQVEKWNEFLYSIHHVRGKDEKLFKQPGSRETITYNSYNSCLNVINIEQDWLKVEHDHSKCNDPGTSQLGPIGYIRWKEGGKLLINFRM